ncbi:MAG: C4-dicarboxylate ABC transporter [Bacillota bacterium]|jgi:TRAP-type C4-dicarboxylate transport system permease large subunit|nr:C4-dicarboxylate ABC transporter [Bacillota bacterium]
MFLTVSLILAVIVVAYIVAQSRLKLSVELAMLVAALVGAVVAGNYLPLRHIAEGSVTYLDLALIFFTATLFMNIIKASGGLDFTVRAIMTRFGNRRAIALILLMFIMLIPGAITGAGSVSVLVSGGAVAMALASMGISKQRIAAIVFLLAGLSAVAPPVSVWAMLTCAGTAIPYVGFEIPLGVPVLVLGVFTVLWLGLRRSEGPGDEAVALPEVAPDVTAGRTILPFLVVFGLIVAARVWPWDMPILGLPLVFMIGAIVAYLLNARKVNFFQVSVETVTQLLPLLTTIIVIGIVIQLLTLTGVRGLISYAVIAMPLWVIFLLLPITIPFSEGVLGFGGAAVIGIPLIWTFNSLGVHPTVALSGLSLLWCLGDALPPTAIIGRLTLQTVGYKGSYGSFLRTCAVPWLVITAVGTLMVVFSGKLAPILVFS